MANLQVMRCGPEYTTTTSVTIGQQSKDPKGSPVPLQHSMPMTMVPASSMGVQMGVPQAEPGSFVIKIVPSTNAQGFVIRESSLQGMPLQEDSATAAKNRTFLTDFSAGTINLDSNWLGGTPEKTPMLVEGYPMLPFVTRRYNRRQIINAMDDAEIFVRNWKIKTVDPAQFHMLGPAAWKIMPHPAPVFVNVPKFGVGMVRYYRWGNTAQIPIL